jgi:hypothetical protein
VTAFEFHAGCSAGRSRRHRLTRKGSMSEAQPAADGRQSDDPARPVRASIVPEAASFAVLFMSICVGFQRKRIRHDAERDPQ